MTQQPFLRHEPCPKEQRPPCATIVTADDHFIFQKWLRGLIEKDGKLKLVGEAVDGREAWRFIQALKPDIAILDINMPHLSGLDLARRAAKDRLPVKIILLTMFEEQELFNEAIEAGAMAYVLKESALTDLLEAIRCVIAGKFFVTPSIERFIQGRGTNAADRNNR
jgi:DNA-binding NarL/FixJ family response regulator